MRAGETIEAIEAERERKIKESVEFGGLRNVPAPELLKRADAIIPDSMAYDVDTRLEVQRLTKNVRDFKEQPDDVDALRRALARVERGQSLANLELIDEGAVEAARVPLAVRGAALPPHQGQRHL